MKKVLFLILLSCLFLLPARIYGQTTSTTTPRASGPLPIAQQQAENGQSAKLGPPTLVQAQQSGQVPASGTGTTSTTPTSDANNPKPTVTLGVIETKYANTPICTSLSNAADKSISSQLKCNETIKTLWTVIIGLVDTVAVVALIAVAFATIMHINYDTYGVKKALPALIIGLVMAHFSLLISRYIVDFAQILEATFYNAAGHSTTICTGANAADRMACNLSGAIFSGGVASINSTWIQGGVFFATLILSLFIIWIPTIVIMILSIELYIRFYLLMFLTIISPAAWLAISWGPIQGMFKKWWGEFVKWTFMGPLVMFYLWLAIKFHEASGPATATFGTYVLSLMMIYLAIQAPKMLGGSIGSAINSRVMGGSKAMGVSYMKGVGRTADSIGNIKPKSWGGETSLRSWSKGVIGNPVTAAKGIGAEIQKNRETSQTQADSEWAKIAGTGPINNAFAKLGDKKAQAMKEISNDRYEQTANNDQIEKRVGVYRNMSPDTLMGKRAAIEALNDPHEARAFALAAAENKHLDKDAYEDILKTKVNGKEVGLDKDFRHRLDNVRSEHTASGIANPEVRDEAVQKHFGSKESLREPGATKTAKDIVGTFEAGRLGEIETAATQQEKHLVDNPNEPGSARKLDEIRKVLERIKNAKSNGGVMFKVHEDLGIEGLHKEETMSGDNVALIDALKKNTVANRNIQRYGNTGDLLKLKTALQGEDQPS